MSKPSEAAIEHRRNENRWIAVFVIGLVIGLLLGVRALVLFSLPKSAFDAGSGVTNVLVWGTVQESDIVSIQFVSLNGNISTSTPVTTTTNAYSVLLVGGQSYNVNLISSKYGWQSNGTWGDIEKTLSLYVPLGEATFTANF